MNASLKKGMGQAFLKRGLFGCLLIVGGGFLLFLSFLFFIKPIHPSPLPSIIMLLLWLSMLGMGIVLPIAGVVSIARAITSFHFKPPLSPKETMTMFMKELFGGTFIPGNPAIAFLCLSNDCQSKWKGWKSLNKAMRLFTQSLKQRHSDTTLWYEITRIDLLPRKLTDILAPDKRRCEEGIGTFVVVFPGGPGEEARRFTYKMEFSLIEVQNHWYIADFQGGPSLFYGREQSTDMADMHVQEELKIANLLIRVGFVTLAITIASFVVGLAIPMQGDTGFAFLVVIPFLLGFATLALIGNGLAKHSKYR